MTILQITTDFAGQVGILPRLVRLLSDDDYSTITGAGYLNGAAAMGVTILPTDFIFASYSDGYGSFNPSFSGPEITLVPTPDNGGVSGPVLTNHIAVFTDTAGVISDDAATAINGGNIQAGLSGTAGYFASFPGTASKGSLRLTAVANTGDTVTDISNAAMGQASTLSIPDPGASTANFIISKSASAATQHITTGALQVDAAALISGISTGGFVGKVQLFPTTASKGSLTWQAVANSGDTATIFQTAALGQATTYTVPDPVGAAGAIVVAPSALVSGNLVKASGTAGLVVDQGFSMKAVAGAAAAGGAAAQSFTDAFCTSGSNVIGNWNTQANAVSVLKIVPGNGSFVVTSSADAGVGTFNYIITK